MSSSVPGISVGDLNIAVHTALMKSVTWYCLLSFAGDLQVVGPILFSVNLKHFSGRCSIMHICGCQSISVFVDVLLTSRAMTASCQFAIRLKWLINFVGGKNVLMPE